MMSSLALPIADPLRTRLQAPLSTLFANAGPELRFWIAFSGGADSSLLLAMAEQVSREQGRKGQLRCIHVDHGMHVQSADWAEHCRQYARGFGLDCRIVRVALELPAGVSPEAWLREQRYRLLADCLEPGDFMLTAHHQDDQAETFLLQALRGSGLRGLSGMLSPSPLGRGELARPWLKVSHDDIRSAVEQLRLSHLDDPSNASLRYDRNYLRHAVLPALAKRWPQWATTLGRAAEWQAEGQFLLNEYAASLFSGLGAERPIPERIRSDRLLALSAAQRRLVMRYWLQQLKLPSPEHRHFQEFERLLLAARDSQAELRFGQAQIRRHGDWLYATWAQGSDAPAPVVEASEWHWDLEGDCELALGRLQAVPVVGQGLRAALAGPGLRVRLRAGGERIRPVGQRHRRWLKCLLQERGIPPWQRARLPLLYAGEQLVAVADLWTSAEAAAGPGEPGLMIHWWPVGSTYDPG